MERPSIASKVGMSCIGQNAPSWTARSHEEEIAGVQCAKLHVREDKLIVVIKVDDNVVVALVAVGHQGGEACEECRHVDNIAAGRAGHKICNARRSRAVLDAHE